MLDNKTKKEKPWILEILTATQFLITETGAMPKSLKGRRSSFQFPTTSPSTPRIFIQSAGLQFI